METLNFLEQLANNTHYNSAFNGIVDEQTMDIRQAFLKSDSSYIRDRFTNPGILANTTQVVMTTISG